VSWFFYVLVHSTFARFEAGKGTSCACTKGSSAIQDPLKASFGCTYIHLNPHVLKWIVVDFAYLISRTFSAKKQCFSLTTNQRTVLFSLSFQRSEHGSHSTPTHLDMKWIHMHPNKAEGGTGRRTRGSIRAEPSSPALKLINSKHHELGRVKLFFQRNKCH
jgi:hypothetical protein